MVASISKGDFLYSLRSTPTTSPHFWYVSSERTKSNSLWIMLPSFNLTVTVGTMPTLCSYVPYRRTLTSSVGGWNCAQCGVDSLVQLCLLLSLSTWHLPALAWNLLKGFHEGIEIKYKLKGTPSFFLCCRHGDTVEVSAPSECILKYWKTLDPYVLKTDLWHFSAHVRGLPIIYSQDGIQGKY